LYKYLDDIEVVTSNGVTKFTYITGGVGVGKSHSSRGFKKQKICSCRKYL